MMQTLTAVAANEAQVNERFERLVEQLEPCPCCAGGNIYWSDCAGKFLIHPAGSHPAYGRLVCMDCGLGTTPCPSDRPEKAAAQWNVRLQSREHSSDYWKAVRAEESRLLETQCSDVTAICAHELDGERT